MNGSAPYRIAKIELANGRVPFDDWFDGLKDHRFQAAVDARLTRVEAGNFGDHKSVGEGVSELRLRIGPGLRIYYAIEGERIVVLLGGGDKRRQSKDIAEAQGLWREYRNESEGL